MENIVVGDLVSQFAEAIAKKVIAHLKEREENSAHNVRATPLHLREKHSNT